MNVILSASAAIAGALLFGLAPTSGASAATITFDTSASELCVGAAGCGVLSQTIGDVMISFSPVGATTVTAEPTTLSNFGQIVMSCIGGGTACGSQSLAGLNLYIGVDQTGPVAASGVLAGAFSGSISGTSSSAQLTFGAPLALGATTYAAAFSPLSLIPARINLGATSAQAMITNAPTTGATVPEPGAWALMIAGFGLAGATLRCRRVVLAD